MLFNTQKSMGGVWKLVAAMHGEEFTAQKMTKTAAVGNSVLQVSGVHQRTRQIMADKFDELLITAHPKKLNEVRFAK